jgi:hypothetical protein
MKSCFGGKIPPFISLEREQKLDYVPIGYFFFLALGFALGLALGFALAFGAAFFLAAFFGIFYSFLSLSLH